MHRRARVIIGIFGLFFAACAVAADPNKVLRFAFPTQETGFDPVRTSDLYSATINEAIFDRLLTYDYLARPAKVVPSAAETMPEVTDGGKTYVFKLRRGIYFTPDPAFKGQKRELTAEDFVYTFKRHADPANRSPWYFMIEGKIEGLDELTEAARKSGKFDYDAVVPGMVALDKYTLRFKLKAPDYLFLYTVAHAHFPRDGARGRRGVPQRRPGASGRLGPLPAQGVEAGDQDRPRGQSRLPRLHLGLPADRQRVGPRAREGHAAASRCRRSAASRSASSRKTSRAGSPSTRRSWTCSRCRATFRPQVFGPDNKLKPEWTAQGVTIYRAIDPDIGYTFFNFRDPLVGGFSKEKIALRRAIIMGYNLDEEIRVIRKNQAVQAQMPIPVGVVGHDPRYRSINQYDPVLANKLLDYFGYKKGADGYRTLPDGKPLVLRQATESQAINREFNELWRKSMDAIGLRMEFDISASSPTT